MSAERYRRSAQTAVVTALLITLQLWSVSPLLSAGPAPEIKSYPVAPVNLLQASERARDLLGGEVIKAELTEYQGGPAYTIRLLEQGRIREVLVDAASGKLVLPEEIPETDD